MRVAKDEEEAMTIAAQDFHDVNPDSIFIYEIDEVDEHKIKVM